MCGINGIISKSSDIKLSQIIQMNQMIKHRGPDDYGFLKFNNTLLGHVRLSIQDLSSKGQQPMSRDGNIWIIFNGEIYNFKEIRIELEKKGYKFISQTDTEVILAAYEEWGDDCLKKFNGMWAFALLDKAKNQIKIVRDRYGVKPCYIATIKDKIIFSSEIKGILASKENFKLDSNTAFNAHDVIREKYFKTIYKDINIVEPGHFYIIDLKTLIINKKRWWFGLENIPLISPNRKIIEENLVNKLIDATKIRLVSDVKIATSLSGGIDSSIIFSILNRFENENFLDLNPFILNFEGNKTFDAAINFTKSLSKKPVIINSADKLDKDNLKNLDTVLSSLETCSTYFKQLILYQFQNKNGFKVSIDGHGADESLGGYTRFFPFFAMEFNNYLVESYEAIFNTKGIETLEQQIKNYNLARLENKFLLDYKNYFKRKPKYIENKYVEGQPEFETPESFINDADLLKEFDYDFQIQYLDATYGNLQWLLNKWDKASMASSVEIRSPFLDWNFFQYALAVPAHMKIKEGNNKSILRKAFKNYLPLEILNLKIKQGLPKHSEIFDETLNGFISRIVNENDFKNHVSWDGKLILKDFDDKEKFTKNQKSIWEIILIYLQQKGYEKRFDHINKVKIDSEQRINLLQ